MSNDRRYERAARFGDASMTNYVDRSAATLMTNRPMRATSLMTNRPMRATSLMTNRPMPATSLMTNRPMPATSQMTNRPMPVTAWREYSQRTQFTATALAGAQVSDDCEDAGDRVYVMHGDITHAPVDAIVSSTPRPSADYTPINAAILRAIRDHAHTVRVKLREDYTHWDGGPTLVQVSPKFHNVIFARLMPHTGDGIKNLYRKCLDMASESGYRSIAFPCIGTGFAALPNDAAATAAIQAVKDWLETNPITSLEAVMFCLYAEEDVSLYEQIMPRFFTRSLHNN